MFLKIQPAYSKKKQTETTYLSLAVSKRVKGKQYPQTEIIHNFGLETPAVRETIWRLHRSLGRYLEQSK